MKKIVLILGIMNFFNNNCSEGKSFAPSQGSAFKKYEPRAVFSSSQFVFDIKNFSNDAESFCKNMLEDEKKHKKDKKKVSQNIQVISKKEREEILGNSRIPVSHEMEQKNLVGLMIHFSQNR